MSYLVRLMNEYDELSERIYKLEKYLAKGDVNDERLLLSQLHYMQGYKMVLKIRLRKEGYDV